MSAFKKLASQTAIYGIPTIAGRFLNYLLVPLYTNLFLPEEYGIVSLLYSAVALFNVILTYGMETTYFRFAKENGDKSYATGLNSIFLTSLLFVLIGWVSADSVAAWPVLNIPDHPEYIRFFVLVLFFDAISALPLAYLRQNNKPARFALIRSVNIFSNLGLNLLFLLVFPKYFSGQTGFLAEFFPAEPNISSIFIANFISSGVTFLLLLPEFRGIRLGFDYDLWKRMMVYSMPLLIVGTAGIVNETIDRMLLEYLLPPNTAKHDIGVYSACYKLSIIMSLFIQAFRFAAEPFFFSHADRSDRTIYAKVTHYFAIFCLIVFLMVSLYIDQFKLFLGSDAYWEGLFVVPILLLANLFLGIYYNLSVWYKLTDNTMKGAYISIGGAILTLVINFVFIPIMGYAASAWATLIVYFSMSVAAYFMGQRYFPVPYKVRRFLLYLILSLFVFLLGQYAHENSSGNQLILWNSLLFLGFCAILFLIEKPKKVLNSQH